MHVSARGGRAGLGSRRRIMSAALVAACSLPGCTGQAPAPAGGAGNPPTPHVTPTPIAPVGEVPGDWYRASCRAGPDLLARVRRGYYPGRSPDVLFIPREPNQFPNNHSGPWDYLQDVPLLLYGPGFIRPAGPLEPARAPTVADLAPTFAELMDTSFPEDRSGRVLREALVPERRRSRAPRLLVTVVWDGGGLSVLDAWPEAWPQLKALSELGTFYRNATVGSSPSVTPAIHATIGTGTFPADHGVSDIVVSEDGAMVPIFGGKSTARLETTTLADLHDRRVHNRAEIGMLAYKGWHLGMVGHGSSLPGGDRDLAAIVDQSGRLFTNPASYSLPEPALNEDLQDEVAATDASDGLRDQRWMGNDVLGSADDLRDTPAWVAHETELVTGILQQEGFGDDRVADLFYVNYKQIDQVGHRWGMLEPEMNAVLAASDDQLGRLVAFLNDHVGRRRWVLALTADHGPAPDLPAVSGWPIHMQELTAALGDRFGHAAADLFLDVRASGLWFQDPPPPGSPSPESVASYLAGYTLEDDSPEGREFPAEFAGRKDEPVFSAAFPAGALAEVLRCAREGSG